MQLLSTTASLLLLLTLAPILVSAVDPKDQAKVVSEFVTSLSDKTYDKFLKDNKVALVEYYAPCTIVTMQPNQFPYLLGCGHCKHLAPEFAKAAEILNKKGVSFGQVDCTEHPKLCENVRGYPTLMVYKDGNSSMYAGGRSSDGIVSYMKKQIRPAVTELTGEQLTEVTKSDEVVIMSFLKSGSAQEAVFNKVAAKLKDDHMFASAKQAVVVFKPFDEKYAVLSADDLTEEKLTEFIQSESVPLMAEIGPENYMKYFESKQPLAYFFYGDDEQRSKYGPAIENAMKEFKGKINAVYIKASQFGQHADSLNLKKEWPGFVVHNMEKDLKYPFEGKEMTQESINKFVGGVLSGEVKATFKSEPIPEKDEGVVKVLVHDNFDQVVFNSPKKQDVLAMFYAPWCGACKNLTPVYEKLAKKIADAKGGDSMIISKFNAVANDLPESLKFELRAYPTIKFFKAGSKEPIDYEGDHSLKAFVDFLNANGSKLNNLKLDKAELEEEEARQQKIKEARENAAKDKKQGSNNKETDEESAEDHKEL